MDMLLKFDKCVCVCVCVPRNSLFPLSTLQSVVQKAEGWYPRDAFLELQYIRIYIHTETEIAGVYG